MSDTFTQIHIHCVFAVKYRQSMINKDWKERLHQYITCIVQNHKHKMIAINSMPDHIHMLFGMRPDQSLSDLMRMVKGDSSEWVNANKITRSKFKWQKGFGAFSYEKKKISTVAAYIKNQEIHHLHKPFLIEYTELLENFGVEYDEKYLFRQPE